MLELKIELRGLKGVETWLKEKAKRFSDLSIPFKQSTLFLFKDIQKHFKDERGSGGSWPKLKSRKGKPLQDTGRLKSSFISASGKDFAKVSTNITYAGIHNDGGSISERFVRPIKKKALHFLTRDGKHAFSKGHNIPTTHIPQREFMWLSDEAKNNILEAFRSYFIKD